MYFFFFFVVDGQWSHWTYLPCGVSCGRGQRNRTRTCTNPPPIGGGKDCSGTGFETLGCYNAPCPGKLLRWSTIIFINEKNKLILQRDMPDMSDVKQGRQYHKRHYVYFFFSLITCCWWMARLPYILVLCLFGFSRTLFNRLSFSLSVLACLPVA